MNKKRISRLMHRVILSAIGAAWICMVPLSAIAQAETGAAMRMANVQSGDCNTCHAGGRQVLPEGHMDTTEMSLQQCLMCHKNDESPVKDKMPLSHVHMLSGISCQKCHGSSGTVSKVDRETCTGCHSIDSLVKAPAKGADRPNPHDSHYGTDVDCSMCHHQHAKSEFFCGQCHKFTNVTPTPLFPLSFLRKAPGEEAPGAASVNTAGEKTQEDTCTDTSAKGAVSAPDCTACHSKPKFRDYFSRTSHGALNCTVCHKGVTDISMHMQKKEEPEPVSCAACHRDVEKEYGKSYHAQVAEITCLQCHTDIHPDDEKGKTPGLQICLKCHNDQERYVNRGHAAKFIAGNTDAPSCTDCHGTHDVRVFASTDKGSADKRAYYTGLCVSCHKEGGVAGGYGVFPMAVESYGETYHGKAMKLGEPDRVAGCADCHLAHTILPADDPASALNPETLVKTCGTCHKGFHPRFVSYVPHPDPDDPKGFLSLYLTKKFMIALLIGVFGFFWIHSLLWWCRVYAEKSRLVKAGLQPKAELPEEEGRQYIRRFGVKERIMHVVLILSFFGVVISGFPLKYADAPWAGVLAAMLGGVKAAANIHRIAAGAMCILFLYTCWLSLKFLFPGFRVRGWIGRLFGPDSLFPRIKDFQDCWGMFKWFLGRGEKPQFDRWTYWEKFDFMAVFWGMFVIGLSGVIMWIPELSSYVIPGWMINITHLAHSEEAFLAAVFIFTIHFFNNHLVPDKFPLEKNVFTGSYTLEALKRERPLEYERILEENRLEEIRCEGPGTSIQLFAGVFGIASVLTGLSLTVLIFWAVLV